MANGTVRYFTIGYGIVKNVQYKYIWYCWGFYREGWYRNRWYHEDDIVRDSTIAYDIVRCNPVSNAMMSHNRVSTHLLLLDLLQNGRQIISHQLLVQRLHLLLTLT